MPLTANQLCNLAREAAKVPGFLQQSGQLLNMILADLADNQNLDLARGTYKFTFVVDNGSGNGSGPYPLPRDYKRVEKRGAFYVYDGTPYNLAPFDYTDFLQQIQQPGIANFPEYFATDISPQGQEPPLPANMYVWPPASFAFPCTVVYRRLLADLSAPETNNEIPWFPEQGYLLDELTGRLCDLVDDSRANYFHDRAMHKLENFMQLTNDDQGRAQTVMLSQTRFSTGFNQLKNTKQIGW